MRFIGALILALCIGSARGLAQDQTVDVPLPSGLHGLIASTSIGLTFKREGLAIPAWEIVVQSDGTGSYREFPRATTDHPEGSPWRPIHVTKATWNRMLGGQVSVEAGHCETKAKHIANTGRKELSYAIGPALSTCSFNYSDDKSVMDAVDAFEAVAETMQEGATLEHKRRFDRLGLDAETISFEAAIKDGRAIELGNIARVLESIARDGEIMERVRARATAWLKLN